MDSIEKKARELLAAEYVKEGRAVSAQETMQGHDLTAHAEYIVLHAIVAALTPQWQRIEFNEDGEPTNVPADTPILVPPTKRLGMTVAKWNPLDGWETETCSEWVGMYRPTHFQPLPAPPEVPQ